MIVGLRIVVLTFTLIQTDRPEAIFSKIEKNLEEAKTISVTFAATRVTQDGKSEELGRGSVMTKRGGKARINIKLKSGAEIKVLSDGIRTERTISGTTTRTEGVLPNHMETVAACLSRLGVAASVSLSLPSIMGCSDKDEPKKELPISDLKLGKDNESLEFKVMVQKALPMKVRVWFDSKNLIIRKREIENLEDQAKKTDKIVEEYSEFSLNAEIADEEFKIK